MAKEVKNGSFLVKVIADSINPSGQRITSLELTYPRFIHAEIMTHRDRARNAASSRAIPWPTMMERIMDNPVIPIKWGMEQGGMQEGDELPEPLQALAREIWLNARDQMVKAADALHNIGKTYYSQWDSPPEDESDKADKDDAEQWKDLKIHKSLPNRLTEPWMFITVIMTATNWKNFFRLRHHPEAEVHFQLLAVMCKEAMDNTPIPLDHGQWHRPYITQEEQVDSIPKWLGKSMTSFDDTYRVMAKISTARCARTSYLTQDGKRDFEKDLGLFERLCKGSGFGHWSPHEHPSQSAPASVRSGPYRGWIQYRKFFDNECAD